MSGAQTSTVTPNDEAPPLPTTSPPPSSITAAEVTNRRSATTSTNGTSAEERDGGQEETGTSSSGSEPHRFWKLGVFVGGVLGLDAIISLVFLSHLWPWMARTTKSQSVPYTFSGSLLDLAIMAVLRITASILALLISYVRAEVRSETAPHVDLYHPNGERKTRDELEQEALEEPFNSWLKRFLARPAFAGEVLAVVTQILGIVKCLVRMNLEMGTLQDADPYHPVFWLTILGTAILSVLEASYLDSMCDLAGRYGQSAATTGRGEGGAGRGGGRIQTPRLFRNISSHLLAPLLQDSNDAADTDDVDEEQPVTDNENDDDDENGENARAVSDIRADTDYKASWSDLLMMCAPDAHYITLAFVFLLLAAVAQVYIPKFLGNILDALGAAFGGDDDNNDRNRQLPMWQVPHFIDNIKLLVLASILAGVFAGLRGSIFTVVGARVNVRLRVKLMDALLSQDIGFFDVTRTGDITSRLSSDTTLVGDQVSLNVNVFLRSLVQAIGVLLFMILVSWQLSILAFISVPLITLLSKWYGNYVRALTKLMQKKLADGNSVSEAALGSMPTVRAFDAAEQELCDFEDSMSKYLQLTNRAAVAYYGYATLSTAMPQLVYAVVVFYGGMLVRNGDMTSGQLVSFLLYLQSLSDAFGTIGWVFSSLTQAVGAADKVFELMHRKPRITPPSVNDGPENPHGHSGILGIEATKTRRQRIMGRRPESARGEIVLDNVEMYYPARPNRRVLNGLSLRIEPGSIVALVGESGGGKSSVMSLIQHLYEQSSGKILFDGIEVNELSPEWISRHVSIVSQEPTLFARSIKKNIMYGLEGTDAEPSEEEIIEAAKLANANVFIESMPQKYETEVGERGVALSGGQKQRIAIARALVRKPNVLLLDEATSALDAVSEHQVQKSIDDLIKRGKGKQQGAMTVIIVAHRLSTVRSADQIFVVRAGQVVEQGTHEDLVKEADGAYSALIRRQMEAQYQLDQNGEVQLE